MTLRCKSNLDKLYRYYTYLIGIIVTGRSGLLVANDVDHERITEYAIHSSSNT